MEKAGNLADERLQRITSIVNEYSAEESHYQRCLDSTNNIASININTPQGTRTLEKQHGRATDRYWSKTTQPPKICDGLTHFRHTIELAALDALNSKRPCFTIK